ncbi:hypothetical protein BLA32_03105 [Borreliella afzelii]|nr:hypothetical protein BLA32_03105 [Borreliella afzelii]
MNFDILNFIVLLAKWLDFLYYSLFLSRIINIFNYSFIIFIFNILFLIKINVNNLKFLIFKLLISFSKFV